MLTKKFYSSVIGIGTCNLENVNDSQNTTCASGALRYWCCTTRNLSNFDSRFIQGHSQAAARCCGRNTLFSKRLHFFTFCLDLC